MEFKYLADHEEAIPVLASWYFNEWGYLGKDVTLDKVNRKLQRYLNADKLPLILLALEGSEILGAAQLKIREMEIYPEKEHWLGGVYVGEKYRGQKVATKIIQKIINIAKNLNVHTLYLQTENLSGGLYVNLGWQAVEQVNYHGLDVLVMKNTVVDVSQ